MTRVFKTDAERERAEHFRALLARLSAGDGEDRTLGADIVEACGVAPAEFGDPTACIDCAIALTDILSFQRIEILTAAIHGLRQRCREGWKPLQNITAADTARAITTLIVRGEIARLEGMPS